MQSRIKIKISFQHNNLGSQFVLPSQFVPVNQAAHLHLYLEMSLGSLLQVAPFKQGLLSHG